VSELALDHVRGDAFAGHLDGVRVAELVGRESSAHAGLQGEAAWWVRTAPGAHGQPHPVATGRACAYAAWRSNCGSISSGRSGAGLASAAATAVTGARRPSGRSTTSVVMIATTIDPAPIVNARW
jgi:hypothetical protein